MLDEISSREIGDQLAFLTSNLLPNNRNIPNSESYTNYALLKRHVFLNKSTHFRRRLTIRAKTRKHNRLLRGKRISHSLKLLTNKSNFNRDLIRFSSLRTKLQPKSLKVFVNAKFSRHFYLLHSDINKNFKNGNSKAYSSDTILTDLTLNTLLPSVNTTSSTVNLYHSKFTQIFNVNSNTNINLYPSSSSFNFKFNTFRPTLTRQLNFHSDITPWVGDALVRLIEFTSGNRAMLQHNMNIESMVDKVSKLTYRRWILRMGYYERTLGHRFFMEEALHIIHLSFKNHDVNLFSS